jgi:hypothetical protein
LQFFRSAELKIAEVQKAEPTVVPGRKNKKDQ